MFLTGFVLCILRLFKLKTEGKTICRKPHCKVTKLKLKFSLNCGYLNRSARFTSLLGLAKSIHYFHTLWCDLFVVCCLLNWG